MANSQRCAVLSITLCLIAAAASAQDDSDCDLSQIFNMDEVIDFFGETYDKLGHNRGDLGVGIRQIRLPSARSMRVR